MYVLKKKNLTANYISHLKEKAISRNPIARKSKKVSDQEENQ